MRTVYLYSTQTAESTLSCLTDPTEQAAPAPSLNLRRASAAQPRAGFAEKGQNGEGLELAFSPLTEHSATVPQVLLLPG